MLPMNNENMAIARVTNYRYIVYYKLLRNKLTVRVLYTDMPFTTKSRL